MKQAATAFHRLPEKVCDFLDDQEISDHPDVAQYFVDLDARLEATQ
jgi:hypothetical protein